MNLFNQLPGFTRSAPGRERHVLRLLPRVLWIGTALLALPSVASRMWAWTGPADDVAASLALLDIYAGSHAAIVPTPSPTPPTRRGCPARRRGWRSRARPMPLRGP